MIKAINPTKRYPHSRTEDIVDAYMRGWNDALDAVQNSKFIINDDRKTEPQKCDDCIWSVCNYNKVDWEQAEQTEPQRNMAEDIVESFGFKAESYRQAKAKTEPQTDLLVKSPRKSRESHEKDTPQTDCAWK